MANSYCARVAILNILREAAGSGSEGLARQEHEAPARGCPGEGPGGAPAGGAGEAEAGGGERRVIILTRPRSRGAER
jgi:hypothetical protein